MTMHKAEDLRENAHTLVQQWDKIRYTRKPHKDFDPADGAKLEVGARYSNADAAFLLLMNLRVMRRRSTTEISLLLGYEYDEDISTDHDESVKFVVQTLGPMAFSLINQLLTDISAKTNEERIPLSAKDQVHFWNSFQDSDPEEVKFVATPEPAEASESPQAE